MEVVGLRRGIRKRKGNLHSPKMVKESYRKCKYLFLTAGKLVISILCSMYNTEEWSKMGVP